MARYIDADALLNKVERYFTGLPIVVHHDMVEYIETAPTADVVERKDLEEIIEAHEKIGFEKGYRDGYAQAIEDAIKSVGLNTWAGSRISKMQPTLKEANDGEIH